MFWTISASIFLWISFGFFDIFADISSIYSCIFFSLSHTNCTLSWYTITVGISFQFHNSTADSFFLCLLLIGPILNFFVVHFSRRSLLSDFDVSPSFSQSFVLFFFSIFFVAFHFNRFNFQ